MKIITVFITFILPVLANTVHAEDACSAWQSAQNDSTGGKYPIQLRSCDVTYGLSAFLQIQNASDERLSLDYRVLTNDDKSKDSEITLEPGSITRAGSCQACARRNTGLKAWEILEIEVLEKTAVTENPDNAAGNNVAETKKPPQAEEEDPAIKRELLRYKQVKVKDEPAKERVVEKPVEVASPEENPKQQKQAEPAVKEPVAEPEGIRQADGTIIPYDQLPPEFRPRK